MLQKNPPKKKKKRGRNRQRRIMGDNQRRWGGNKGRKNFWGDGERKKKQKREVKRRGSFRIPLKHLNISLGKSVLGIMARGRRGANHGYSALKT